MKSNRVQCRSVLALALVLSPAVPAVTAKGIDDFTLTKAIPADAFIVMHARDHAGLAFLNKQLDRVWAAVEKARFDRDFKRLFQTMAKQGDQTPEAFEEQWQQLNDLLMGVEWSTLCQREWAFAERLGGPSFWECVLLMMPPADKVKDDFKGLGAILKTVAEFAPDAVTLTEDDHGDTVIYKLAPAQVPLPMSLTLARHGDVLLLGFGSAMPEQSLAMLTGQGGEALASTPRFKAAFKRLPAPTDGLVFVDVAKMFEQLRAILGTVKGMLSPPVAAQGAADETAADEQAVEVVNPGAQAVELGNKLLDALDMFDCVATVSTTDGMRTVTDSICLMRDDAKSKPLYAALFGTGTLKDPLKHVPKNAGDVGAYAGIDWLALYQELVKFVSDEVPGGAEQIAQWNAMQEVWEFNVEQDLLGWIQGNLVSFSVPGKTPYSPGDFAFMLRVKDEQKAREMLGRLFDVIEPILLQQNGAVQDAEIEGTQGFRSVIYPMLAFVGLKSPTLGVSDGWLFVGSSPAIIESALAVASGEAESFANNERFRKEGLPPGQNLTSLSFTDLTKLGEQLGQMFKMAPMVGMMLGQQLAKNPAAQTALRIASKLGGVLEKLDFFQSSSSQSTFDGKVWATKAVTNYREPPAPKPTPKPPPEPETGSETQAETGSEQ